MPDSRALAGAAAGRGVPDGLARATEALSNQAFDAQTFVAHFEGADAGEVANVKLRLTRLMDLDAIARAACRSELGKTAAAMDRVQHLRTQRDVVTEIEGFRVQFRIQRVATIGRVFGVADVLEAQIEWRAVDDVEHGLAVDLHETNA